MIPRCCLLLSLAACAPAPATPDATIGLAVEVQPARRDSITEVIALTGRLMPVPGGSATLSAPVDAMVQAIAIRVGQQVRAGEQLIRLDAPELVMAAERMQAQALADSLDLARQRHLFEEGVAARRVLDERMAAATGSRADASTALRLLQRAELQSPIAGVVQRIAVQPGERVSAGQSLVEVVSGAALDFHAAVPVALLVRLRTGQSVAFAGDSGTPPVNGRIIGIAPAVDSITGLGEVVVHIPRAGQMLAGAGVTGALQLRQLRDVFVVPESALVPADGRMQLYVVQRDSIARARPVQVLLRNSGRAAISGDLAPGDLIVVSGSYGLSDSMAVTPVARR